MSVAGLVLGIVSTAFCWFWPISLFTGIVGIVMGAMGRKKDLAAGLPTGKATAGLALSIVGLSLTVLFVVCIGIAAVGVSSAAGYLGNSFF